MASIDDDFALALTLQAELLAAEAASDPNVSLALQLLAADFASQQQIQADARMAESIRDAVVLDARIVAALQAEEDQATQDRALAQSLQQQGTRTATRPVARQRPAASSSASTAVIAAASAEKLYDVWWHGRKSTTTDAASSSKITGFSARQHDFTVSILCSVCVSPFPVFETALLPCEHQYCLSCLRQHLRASLTGQTAFPPSCCGQPMSLSAAADVFTAKELEAWAFKMAVHQGGMGGNTLTCSGRTCGAALLPGCVKDNVGLCVSCGTRTCALCGRGEHDGVCPRDEDTESLYKAAEKSGWQRCPRCGNMVELKSGCYHITCRLVMCLMAIFPTHLHSYILILMKMNRCQMEFCYICAAKWGTCRCERASERGVMGLLRGAERSAGSISRKFPSTQRTAMLTEHRIAANAAIKSHNEQIAKLRVLASSRNTEREALRVNAQVWAYEVQVNAEVERKMAKLREEQLDRANRRQMLLYIMRSKLDGVWERMNSRGKGKEKVDESGGQAQDVAAKIVGLTLVRKTLGNTSTCTGP